MALNVPLRDAVRSPTQSGTRREREFLGFLSDGSHVAGEIHASPLGIRALELADRVDSYMEEHAR